MKRKENTQTMRSGDGKRRGRGSKDKKVEEWKGAGEECEECTQIQGTRTHNHGNQALNFNPSCSRYHGHPSIRTPHPLRTPSPSSGLSLSHLTRGPEKAVIISRLSEVLAAVTSTFTLSLAEASSSLAGFVFTWHLKMTHARSLAHFFWIYLTEREGTTCKRPQAGV